MKTEKILKKTLALQAIMVFTLGGCGQQVAEGEIAPPGQAPVMASGDALGPVLKEVASLKDAVKALQVQAGAGAPWVLCGRFADLDDRCELPKHPQTHFEYGGRLFNAGEPLPVLCTGWNKGLRLYNRDPYIIDSDNPEMGMKRGGVIYYKGTDAGDECRGSIKWRQRYWFINAQGAIELSFGNGCYDNEIYCRERR
jgi:hypothetical protein